MKVKGYFFSALTILFFISAGKTNAQFEGYGSVTYGYSKNPLYNYLQEGDQQKESFLNLKYNKDFDYSALNFSYTGGLMLFNRFDDRNYYEQLFGAEYIMQLVNEDAETSEKETDFSKVNELNFGASAGGRIDKVLHTDYDNYVVNIFAGYKNKSSEEFPYELNNTFSFRNYTGIGELSNLTDILKLQIITGDIKQFSYGIKLSAGIKYYTTTVYDTSQFETVTTTPGNGNGNGHGRGNGSGGGNSGGTTTTSKQILTQPQEDGTHQITAGFYVGKQFGETTISADVLYRYNTRSNVRYLAQYVNTSFLTEDIYNDFFSYEGPEADLKFNTLLPLQLKLNLHATVENKKFAAPAFDLDGNQSDANRKDIRSVLEVSLGKYFELGLGFGAEVSLNYSLSRNQSNDMYNDFSNSFASVGVGIGF